MSKKMLYLFAISILFLLSACISTINLKSPEREGAVLIGRFERFDAQKSAPWMKMDTMMVAHACMGEVFGVGPFRIDDEKGFFAAKIPLELDAAPLQITCQNGGGQAMQIMKTKVMDLRIAAKPADVFLVPAREFYYSGSMSLIVGSESIKTKADEKSNQEIIDWLQKTFPDQTADPKKVTVLK